MNVKATSIMRASLAAYMSMRHHQSCVGFALGSDIIAGRTPYVGSFTTEHALAARADELEADALSREATALRLAERAA